MPLSRDPHIYRHRVRFRECDQMGIVYHVHYLDWFEIARTEALRDLGMPYKQIENSGVMLPVTDLKARYFSPARYDDEIFVETHTSLSESGVRIYFDYVVRRESDSKKLATGQVVLCFFDSGRKRPVAAPDHIQAKLRST